MIVYLGITVGITVLRSPISSSCTGIPVQVHDYAGPVLYDAAPNGCVHVLIHKFLILLLSQSSKRAPLGGVLLLRSSTAHARLWFALMHH